MAIPAGEPGRRAVATGAVVDVGGPGVASIPRRSVTHHRIEFVTRDRTGITAVVTATGVVDADAVIRSIQAGHSGYYVAPNGWRRAPVRTLSVLGGAYLFANWDGTKRNNLHDIAAKAPTRSIEQVKPAESRFRTTLLGALAALFGRSDRTA